MKSKLPEGWEIINLGKIINLHDSKRIPLSVKKRKQQNKIFPYYGANGIIDYVDDYIFDGEYILLAEDGSVMDNYGNAIVYDVSGKFWVSNHAHVFESIADKCNQLFLYYSLKNTKVSPYITGAVQLKINQGNLKRIPLVLPPINEQKAIADTLSALDDKIENNNKINENLEAQAQAIFKHWFVEFEFPNENGEPYKSSGGEMVESELGMIPEGWGINQLKNVVKIKYGKNLPVKNLLESGYDVFGGNGIIGYFDEYIYEDPEVLIACRGAASGEVNISNSKSFVTNNSLILESPSRIIYEYIKEKFISENLEIYVTGSAQPQITITNIKDVLILIPIIGILNKFYSISSALSSMISENKTQNQKLVELRDTLLPKLMSGELRIPLD